MSEDERARKRARTAGERAVEVAGEAGTIAATPSRSLDVGKKARVSIMDETRYIPQGFDRTGKGYGDYVHTAADMSKHQYQASRGQTEATQIGGYTRAMYTEATDNPYYALWVNEETQHAFIVYKGTNREIEWFNQNIDVFTGNIDNNSYFQDAYRYYQEAVNELGPGYTIDVTGHSLGGAKSMYVAARAKRDYDAARAIGGAMGEIPPPPHSISFNPGIGPGIREKLGFVDNSELLRFPEKEYNLIVRNEGDPASYFSGEANTITFDNYTIGKNDPMWLKQRHGISQFTSAEAEYTEGTFESALDMVMRRPDGAPATYIAGTKASVIPERLPGVGARGVELLPGNPLGPSSSASSSASSSVADPADNRIGQGMLDEVINGPQGNPPGPSSSDWAAFGEDVAAAGEDVVGAGVLGGDTALVTGLAEIAATTTLLPLEVLNLMTLGQQVDDIARYFENKQKMDNAGQWATIMQLTTWTPSMWDTNITGFDSMFETDHYKDYVSNTRRDRVLDFYKSPLKYSPFLFDSKVEYGEYLKDIALHGDDWQRNFSIVARQYAKHQANDQIFIDTWAAKDPMMKKRYIYNTDVGDPRRSGLSGSFVGTDVKVQDMGVLLAQQYAILQNEENKLRPSYIGQDGKRVYGKSASDLKNNLDADAIKSIFAAVGRKEYIDKYYGNNDGTYSGIDFRNLPTYEAAYYGYVNNSEDIGTTRAEYDKYIADKEYIPLKNFLDQYSTPDMVNLDRNNLSDGVYAFREGDDRLVRIDSLPPQVLQQMWNHGFHFFESAQDDKYHWGARAATEYSQNKYLFDRSKDVNWKKYGLDGNNMAMVNLEGATQHNNYKAGRPYNKQIFSYWGTEGRNWDEQFVQDEQKREEMQKATKTEVTELDRAIQDGFFFGNNGRRYYLQPAHGPHATTDGPDVPPRNVHDLPPAYPHSDIDGGPKDKYDGYSNWDGDKIDPQHHYHDGESTTSYHSYDTNHHIQEPETASNLSQNAYTQAAKFFQRTFVSNPEMHRRGRNNVMWAELADVNGDLVEKAADLLAS